MYIKTSTKTVQKELPAKACFIVMLRSRGPLPPLGSPLFEGKEGRGLKFRIAEWDITTVVPIIIIVFLFFYLEFQRKMGRS